MITSIIKRGMKSLIRSQTSTVAPLKFGKKDIKLFHSTLYKGYNHVSVPELKLNRVNQRGSRCVHLHISFKRRCTNSAFGFCLNCNCIQNVCRNIKQILVSTILCVRLPFNQQSARLDSRNLFANRVIIQRFQEASSQFVIFKMKCVLVTFTAKLTLINSLPTRSFVTLQHTSVFIKIYHGSN